MEQPVLGVALILISAIGLLVDGLAERRAFPYTKALKVAAVTQTTQTGDSD